MKNHRSHVGRTRLILILLCIVLAAAMLWCALSLVLKIGTYSSRTVGDDKPAEEVPVEPADLEPTVAENSYDPAGFYEEGGFKRYKSADTIASVGVDVSSHQQDIDWELVAANGVEFAMIRVGYRGYTQGALREDSSFRTFVRGARAAGIDVGVYFFSQAVTVQEAIMEADYVLGLLDGVPLDLPVYFDWEPVFADDSRTASFDASRLTNIAAAFCRVVEQGGCSAGIYLNRQQGYYQYDLSRLADWSLWVADYNDYPDFYYAFDMWQYSDSAALDGVPTQAVLNFLFVPSPRG